MKKEVVSVFLNNWPTIAVVVCIYLVMRLTYVFKGERKSVTLYDEIINICFFIYLILFYQLITNQEISNGSSNLMPFKEIFRYSVGSVGFYKQVIFNTVLFIPLGYYISRYCRLKSLFGIFLVSLLSSLCVECIQFFTIDIVDIDDVIMNIIGGILGFLLYIALNAIKNHLPKFLKHNWFYNLICILIIVIIATCVFDIF